VGRNKICWYRTGTDWLTVVQDPKQILIQNEKRFPSEIDPDLRWPKQSDLDPNLPDKETTRSKKIFSDPPHYTHGKSSIGYLRYWYRYLLISSYGTIRYGTVRTVLAMFIKVCLTTLLYLYRVPVLVLLWFPGLGMDSRLKCWYGSPWSKWMEILCRSTTMFPAVWIRNTGLLAHHVIQCVVR